MKNIDFCGDSVRFGHKKQDNVPENMNTRHCHDEYEIIYVVDGVGRYVVEGVEYPVMPRTLMIFPPLTFHCVHLDDGCRYERFVVYFNKSDVADGARVALEALNSASVPSGSFYSAESISDSITSVFDRFELVPDLPSAERTVFSRLLVSELVILLSVAKREDFNHDDGELGARVIRYLNNNMDRDISLDNLAKRFFVSKYYLCRAFKKHNGISIHGYINQKRVMYAKQLIESGETASGAAYKVGFGDYSAFYRAYVKVVGKAPSAIDGRKESK